jgi:uncharacterized protein with PIN domain
MIVVDSSVFIAILEQEPDAERFLSIIRDATRSPGSIDQFAASNAS